MSREEIPDVRHWEVDRWNWKKNFVVLKRSGTDQEKEIRLSWIMKDLMRMAYRRGWHGKPPTEILPGWGRRR